MNVRKKAKRRSRKSDLDVIVFLCVIAGMAMTAAPLVLWFYRGEFIPDAYFQYGFSFWGKELIASVAVYWLKGRKNKAEETEGNNDNTIG